MYLYIYISYTVHIQQGWEACDAIPEVPVPNWNLCQQNFALLHCTLSKSNRVELDKMLCCMMESFCWPICCAAYGSFLSSVCHPPETFHLIACTATAPPSTRTTLGRYVRRKIDRRVLYMAMRIIRYTVHCPL